MHCKLTGWKWLNRPVLNLLGIVLHRRPPLLHLHHQALKQPLLILQGFPDLRHPEHRRNHHTHPSKTSIIYSVGIRGEKNNPAPQKKAFNLFTLGGRGIMQVTLEAATVPKHHGKGKHMNT